MPGGSNRPGFSILQRAGYLKRKKGFVIGIAVLLVITISVVAKYKSIYRQEFHPIGPIAADIRGQVQDADGKPVGGVTVYYITRSADYRCQTSRIAAKTRTNAEGYFTYKNLRGCDRGAFVVYERGKFMGLCAGPSWPNMLPESIDNMYFDITVRSLKTANARVVTDNGEPLTGVDVCVDGMHYGHAYLPYSMSFADIELITGPRTARTDANGTFALQDIPEGSKLMLDTRKPGYAMIKKSWCTAPYCTAMTRAGTVRGRVLLSSGRPLVGAAVVCIDMSNEQRADTKTDKNGSYELEVPPGDYSVEASSTTHYIHESDLVKVSAGGKFKADLRAYPFTFMKGQVLDSATGLPVRDVEVSSMWWSRNGYSATVGKTATVKVDAQGRFSLPVPPKSGLGTYASEGRSIHCELWAGNIDGNPYYRTPDHSIAGYATEHGMSGVKLMLDRVELLRGAVVDEKDRPVSGAVIDSDWGMEAASGADGSFVMPRIPENVVCIKGSSRWHNVRSTIGRMNNSTRCVEPDGFYVENRQHDQGSFTRVSLRGLPSYRLAVQPAAKLRVIVRDNAGVPIKGALVTANMSYGAVLVDDLNVVSNAKGEAVISGLYAGGECSLKCSADGYEDLKVSLAEVGSKNWTSGKQVTLRPVSK